MARLMPPVRRRFTRLGRFIGRYRAAYFIPEKTNGSIVYSYRPRPGAEDR